MLQEKVCFARLERKDTYVQANIPINADARAVSGEASAPVRSTRVLVSGSHGGVHHAVPGWRYTWHDGPPPTALGHRDPHWRFAVPGTFVRRDDGVRSLCRS